MTAEIITDRNELLKSILLASFVQEVDRKYEVDSAGYYTNLDQTNRFNWYMQVSTLSPHIFIPLVKLSLSIAKGFRITGTDKTKVEEYTLWAKKIGLREKTQTLSRLLVRDGTYVAKITDFKQATFNFEPVLMSAVTMYPEGYNPANGTSVILTPPIGKIFINEQYPDISEELTLKKVIYGAIYPRDKVFKDILGKQTFGMYGLSMLESIEYLIPKYLDLIEGYTEYIKRYGIGRYHIDYDALTEFVKEGDINKVNELLDNLTERHADMQQNEDIIGTGFKVHQLDTGGSNIDVTGFKESLEKDIQIGLMQAPLTMGRAEGTTFASGYISEEDRMVALEGIQNIVKDIVNQQIIAKREGPNYIPGEVEVEFEELSKPKVDIKDLEQPAKDGRISIQEWRTKVGLPAERDPNQTYMTLLPTDSGYAEQQAQLMNQNPLLNQKIATSETNNSDNVNSTNTSQSTLVKENKAQSINNTNSQ